jgi:hypothetical protein
MDGSVVMGPSTSPHRTPTRKVEIKSISLALQGGGAHGAFVWGVLDRPARGRTHPVRRYQRDECGRDECDGSRRGHGLGRPVKARKRRSPGYGAGSAIRH